MARTNNQANNQAGHQDWAQAQQAQAQPNLAQPNLAQPARGQRPGEFAEPGLPWNSAAPAQPQHDPHGGQLPWPQQAGNYAQQGYAQPQQYAQQQAAPALQQYQPQQNYAPGSYAPPTFPQPAPMPAQSHADAHHGHYFSQAPAQQQLPSGHDYPPQQVYAANGYAPAQQGYADPYTAPPSQHAGFGAPGQAQYQPQAPHLRTAPPPPVGAQAHPHGHPHAQAHGQHADHDEDEYEDEEDEEPRRRFGILKVLGVMAVAVALGGGAAYGVKKFGGSIMTAQTKPVNVKADASPSRSAKAGNAASADSKASERVGDSMPAVVAADIQSNEGPATARKVQTIPIQPNSAAAVAPSRPTVSMPGLVLDGLAPAQQQAALPPVTPAPQGRAVAPPPVTPQAAAAAPAAQRAPVQPKVIASADEPAAAKAAAAPAAVAKAAVARAPKSSDAYSPASGVGAATVAAATTTGSAAPAAAPRASNGFVAVLSSQPNAIEARKQLDDLQGKFGEVLGGKPSDVAQFDNPSDGKTYYRAIVGPPGSRDAANAVCAQMRTAGHKGCFAAAY